MGLFGRTVCWIDFNPEKPFSKEENWPEFCTGSKPTARSLYDGRIEAEIVSRERTKVEAKEILELYFEDQKSARRLFPSQHL